MFVIGRLGIDVNRKRLVAVTAFVLWKWPTENIARHQHNQTLAREWRKPYELCVHFDTWYKIRRWYSVVFSVFGKFLGECFRKTFILSENVYWWSYVKKFLQDDSCNKYICEPHNNFRSDETSLYFPENYETKLK